MSGKAGPATRRRVLEKLVGTLVATEDAHARAEIVRDATGAGIAPLANRENLDLLVEAMRDESRFIGKHGVYSRMHLMEAYRRITGSTYPEREWTNPYGATDTDCGLEAALGQL